MSDDRSGLIYNVGYPTGNGTVDGNKLTVDVDIANNGTSSVSGSLSVKDAVFGTLISRTVTVPASTPDYPVSFILPTDGMAWKGGRDDTLDLTASFNGAVSDDVYVSIQPRPVVMVPGLGSDYTLWKDWYKPGGYLQGAGYPASLFGPKGVGEHYGYPVDTTNTKNTPTKFTWQNAQALDKYVNLVRNSTKADKVDLVAHSMGGLIARYYISKDMDRGAVTRLIMLGTPNMGSNSAWKPLELGGAVGGVGGATIGALLFPEPATLENTPQFVQSITNHEATDRKGVHFFAIGGNTSCLSGDGSPSDMIVSRDHVRTLPVDMPPPGLLAPVPVATLTAQEYADKMVVHIPELGLLCNYLSGETESYDVFSSVLTHLQDTTLATPDMRAAASASASSTDRASVLSPHAPDTTTSPSDTTSPILAAHSDSLAPGQSITLTVRSASLTDLIASVYLREQPTDTRPLLSLTAPTGAVSTGDAQQAGVTYTDNSAGTVFPFIAFSTQQPQDGIWTLTVTNPVTSNVDQLPVVAEMRTNSTIGMALSTHTDLSSYYPGQEIAVTATLARVNTDGTTQTIGASEGTTVTAQIGSISRPGVMPAMLTLYDDGAHGDGAANDGVYGTSLPAPDQTGEYDIAVNAEWSGQQRIAQTSFVVTSLTPAIAPEIDLSPDNASSGATFVITSTACFSANEQVAVAMGSVSLGTASVDQTGALSVTETVPAGLNGEVPVTVTGQSSGVVATAPFAVLVADQPVTPTVTPSTTPSLTATNTPTPTGTNTSTATATATATRTATPSVTPTSTPTWTAMATNTAVPTSPSPPMATPLPPSPPPTSPPPTPIVPAPTNTTAPPANPTAATATSAPSGPVGVATQGPAATATATAMPRPGRPASTSTTGANRPVPVQATDTPAPQTVSTSPPHVKSAGKSKAPRIVVDVSVPGGTVTENSIITVSGGARSYNTVDIVADLSTTTFVNQKAVIYVRPGTTGTTGTAGSNTRPRTRPDAKSQPPCRKGVRGCVVRTVTRRVARTTRLYHTTARTRADRTGRFKAIVRLRYRTRKTLQATLTVTVRTAQGQSARHTRVTVTPPPAQGSTGKAGKRGKR